MIKTNMRRFLLELSRAVDAQEFRYAFQVQDVARDVLKMIVETSPQFSGQYAASWRVRSRQTRGRVSASFDDFSQPVTQDMFRNDALYAEYQDGNYANIKFRGDAEAVNYAMAVNEPFIKKLRLNSRMEFYNPMPYARNIAENISDNGKRGYLRAGNYMNPAPIPLGYVRQKLSGFLEYRTLE
jgi:hypothetical protein